VPTTDQANDIVLKNMGLVHHVSKKYRYASRLYGIDQEDIVSAGYVGLIKASRSYDPNLGVKFSTFSGVAISRSITRFINANKSALTVSRDAAELLSKINKLGLENETARKITEIIPCNLNVALRALRLKEMSLISLDKEVKHEDIWR
jgi:RNA polymerase sigma factor (sigma-70 family)